MQSPIDQDAHSALLGPRDPLPVQTINPRGSSSFLLIGDHAGAAIPASLGKLGLNSADLARHIALDLGVQAFGEMLAAALDAPFLFQPYSRLLIDCNRAPGSAEAILEVSDGTVIRGNLSLPRAARNARVAAVHEPYQTAISDLLASRDEKGRSSILISLHSFTPVLAGRERPWQIGVLHDGGDPRFACALLEAMRRDIALVVGDNEPYRMDATDHTVPRHAYEKGRPYAELEFRQDVLADRAEAEGLAIRLSNILISLEQIEAAWKPC